MPTKLFFELSEEKRTKIIDASIAEFAQYGYNSGSTNRIVQIAGISKGSLFKYFQNKDELYFFILDMATQELTADLARKTRALSKNLFERIVQYSEAEFAWYLAHPEKCRLITAASTRSDAAIYREVEARYGEQGREIYDGLLEDIDTSALRLSREKTAHMIRWFLKGFNEDFITGVKAGQDMDIDGVRRAYIKNLTEYMAALKSGLMAR